MREWPKISDEGLNNVIDKYFPFDSYRVNQKEAIRYIVKSFMSGTEHFFLEAPTGIGKSAIAVTVHRVLQHLNHKFRTTIATKTKNLQDVYKSDYREVFDLRSKTNYPCSFDAEHYDTVRCKVLKYTKKCEPRMSCQYVRARELWSLTAKLRSTNHSFVLEACDSVLNQEGKRADLTIIDECHDLNNKIIEHSVVSFKLDDIKTIEKIGLQYANKLKDLTKKLLVAEKYERHKITKITESMVYIVEEMFDHSANLHDDVNSYILATIQGGKTIEPEVVKALDKIDNLKENCEVILAAADDPHSEFVVMVKEDNTLNLKPLHAKYTAYYKLFRKTDYFLHMSSTICGFGEYAKSLGIVRSTYDSLHLPSPFPKENRKIFFNPVSRFNNQQKEVALKRISEEARNIVKNNKGKRGLIHSVSYANANYLVDNAQDKERFYIPKNAADGFSYLRSREDGILVSPSMEEGYDLVGELCRFQILMKVPYGFLGDPIIKFNMQKDFNTYVRAAVMRIVQASGRAVRSEKDFADTYILDAGFSTILEKYKYMIPEWYQEAILIKR